MTKPGETSGLQACFAQLGKAQGWLDMPMPADLASKTAERPGGTEIVLHCQQRRHRVAGHTARFMRLEGPKVEVQTLFIYPDPAWPLPVLAAETVLIGGRAQVLVLDLPVLLAADNPLVESTAGAMQALALQFDLASEGGEVPEWYQSCRSGHAIFLRCPEDAMLHRFNAYAQAATHTWLEWMAQESAKPLPKPGVSVHAQAIADYKQHHCEHSPATALVSRCFGPDWTRVFMQAFFA